MKHTNTSVKPKEKPRERVKRVGAKEESLKKVDGSRVGVSPARVVKILRKLNPDAFKYRDDKNYNKKIAEIDKNHTQFHSSVVMTSVFFNVFSGNPDQFNLLLSDDIKKQYRFEESWANPEWVYESIDEMCCDMAFENKYFTYNGNGIFITLGFTTKKKAMKLDDIIHGFTEYMREPWSL